MSLDLDNAGGGEALIWTVRIGTAGMLGGHQGDVLSSLFQIPLFAMFVLTSEQGVLAAVGASLPKPRSRSAASQLHPIGWQMLSDAPQFPHRPFFFDHLGLQLAQEEGFICFRRVCLPTRGCPRPLTLFE